MRSTWSTIRTDHLLFEAVLQAHDRQAPPPNQGMNVLSISLEDSLDHLDQLDLPSLSLRRARVVWVDRGWTDLDHPQWLPSATLGNGAE
jgi:hypothetical protein